MRKKILTGIGIAVLLSVLVVLSGCVQQPAPETKYVCPGGSTVSDPKLCPTATPLPTPATTSIPSPPSIVQYSPSAFTSDVPTTSRTFSIEVNQTSDIIWEINGSEVQSNKNVTKSSYTNASAQEGVWMVAARASNSNGTSSKVWIWTVKAPTPTPTEAETVTPKEPDIALSIRWEGSDVYSIVLFLKHIDGDTLNLRQAKIVLSTRRGIVIFDPASSTDSYFSKGDEIYITTMKYVSGELSSYNTMGFYKNGTMTSNLGATVTTDTLSYIVPMDTISCEVFFIPTGKLLASISITI